MRVQIETQALQSRFQTEDPSVEAARRQARQSLRYYALQTRGLTQEQIEQLRIQEQVRAALRKYGETTTRVARSTRAFISELERIIDIPLTSTLNGWIDRLDNLFQIQSRQIPGTIQGWGAWIGRIFQARFCHR